MSDIGQLRIPELKKYAAKLYLTERRSDILAWIHEYYMHPINPNEKYLAVFLAGEVSIDHMEALTFLRKEVNKDTDWRTQEVLAKAFDTYCSNIGYEHARTVIESWLSDPEANVRRAVTEGLRIWTARPYFKDNPEVAVNMVARLKADPSEYVRKSVGNALSDISKKHQELIMNELLTWNLNDPLIQYTFKKASRHL